MLRRPTKVLVELRPSIVHQGGVGVFAVPQIQKGERVCRGIHDEDYTDVVPWSCYEMYDANERRKVLDFCVSTPDGFIPPPNFDFNGLSVMWFLNHACSGNCGFDQIGDIIALRQIEAGEEITYDYGLAESDPNFVLLCTCGHESCRRRITGNDWKCEEFRASHLEFMLPRLRGLA